jgi:hypothetical protein
MFRHIPNEGGRDLKYVACQTHATPISKRASQDSCLLCLTHSRRDRERAIVVDETLNPYPLTLNHSRRERERVAVVNGEDGNLHVRRVLPPVAPHVQNDMTFKEKPTFENRRRDWPTVSDVAGETHVTGCQSLTWRHRLT